MNQINLTKCSSCHYKGTVKLKSTPIRKSKVMLIGESPGMNELTEQKPFIGKSGKLLRDTLKKVGLDDSSIFITNTILCRPQNDSIPREVIKCCRDRLMWEIEQVDPTYIITLGAVALKSMTLDFSIKITKVSGRVFKHNGRSILPTIHPALVLRSAGTYSTFYSDLQYFSNIINETTKVKNPGESKYVVIDTKEKAKRVVDMLNSDYNMLSADIETGGKRINSPIVALGISPQKNFTIIFTDKTYKYTKPLFDNSKIKFIWQNGQFDTLLLRYQGFKNVKVDHDTMLLHYCLDENIGGNKLSILATRYLGAEDYSSAMEKHLDKQTGYMYAPKDLLYKYLAKDCDYTRQLYYLFFPIVNSDPNLKWVYDNIMVPGSNFVSRVKENGMLVDVDYTKDYGKKLDKRISEKLAVIKKYCQPIWDKDFYMAKMDKKSASDEFNPDSPYQLQWMIHHRLKLKPSYRRKYSAGKKVLQSCIDQHPVVKEVLDYKALKKVKSNYVEGVLKRLDYDSRIRSNLNLHTTVTGRLSSTEPNLQNIKRDPEVKNIFTSPEGRILMEADYKAAELRALAMMSKDSSLINIFNEGRDLHSEVAKDNFGENFTKEERVKAKSVNFGIIYGITSQGLSRDLSISVKEAQKLIDNWYNQFPKAKEYLEEQDSKLERGDVLITPLGRKRRYGVIDRSKKLKLKRLKNEARNFAIQSLASDFTFISAMRLEYIIKEFNAIIINLVHDSIIIELPNNTDTIREVEQKVKEIMENTPYKLLKTEVPFPVDTEIGRSWGMLK